MYFLIFFLYFSLLLKADADFTSAKNPQECLLAIAENLSIKNIITVLDAQNLNLINPVKYLSRNNIYSQFTSLRRLILSVRKSKLPKPNTLYLIISNDILNNLKPLFNEKNEIFLSENKWIIFYDYNLKITDFTRIYIPYDCQFLVVRSLDSCRFIISEVYHTRILTQKVIISHFGEWDEINNLQISETDFYQRRFNLNETILPVGGSYLPGSCPYEQICVYEEIVDEMARAMNFHLAFLSYEELEDIRRLEPKLIYEIFLGLFVFDSFTYRKYSVAPIWKTQAYLHIKYVKSYEQGEEAPYLRPFEKKVWNGLIIWLIVAGASVAVIDYFVCKKNQDRPAIIDSVFLPFESFTNQCGCNLPNAIPSRISALVTRLGPAFMIPLYSAVIISFVTVEIIKLPFTDLQGLTQEGSFKVAYENVTVIQKILQESHDPTLKLTHEKFEYDLEKMPKNEVEAADKICKNRKMAFAYFNNDLYFQEHECKILQIPKPIYTAWDAFWLRDASNFNIIFNRLLKSFRSAGILKRMEKNINGERAVLDDIEDVEPVELENVLPLLTLIALMYLLIIFIFIIELIFHKISF